MKSCYIFLIFLVSILSLGCATVVTTGVTMLGVKAATDARTLGTQIDDNTLELRVTQAFKKNKNLQSSSISASAYQGKVVLIGQCPTADLVIQAEKIAHTITGVTKVYNHIHVGNNTSFRHYLSDIRITNVINFKLLMNNKLKLSNVKVITENGEVFLLGLVTKHEATLITKIAHHINGVINVVNMFTIRK